MMQLSRCFHATSQFEYALKYYDRCIELQPEDYRPRLGRGQCLLKLERFPEALESIEAALELKPDLISALRDKGKSLCHAEGSLFHLLCVSWSTLLDAAECYNKMGQYEDCISTADKALEDHPENATIWGLRGKAYLLLVETLTLLSILRLYVYVA
jgi:tetratricopeptide (TPR) repeat protein